MTVCLIVCKMMLPGLEGEWIEHEGNKHDKVTSDQITHPYADQAETSRAAPSLAGCSASFFCIAALVEVVRA